MYYPSDCFILYLLVLLLLSHSLIKAGTAPTKVWFPALHRNHGKTIVTNNAMITLYVEENNPITPNFYNNLIACLQFHRLTCTCGHSGCLSIQGYYTRFLKTPDGRIPFRICRVVCSCCHHTHALLLSSFVLYSQVSLPEQSAIISSYEEGKSFVPVMDKNPSIDESNCRYVIRKYLHHWKQRILSERIPLSRFPILVLNCFHAFFRQFMQIRCTPNILFLNTT